MGSAAFVPICVERVSCDASTTLTWPHSLYTASNSHAFGRCCRYASFAHFCMKFFFAAPASGLPLLPTAFTRQDSRLHFFRKLVLAAPASGLSSLLTALLSQVSCADA